MVGDIMSFVVEGLCHFILCVLVRHEKGGSGIATVWILKGTIREQFNVERVHLKINHSKGVYVKVKVAVSVKKNDFKIPLNCRTHAISACVETSTLVFDIAKSQ